MNFLSRNRRKKISCALWKIRFNSTSYRQNKKKVKRHADLIECTLSMCGWHAGGKGCHPEGPGQAWEVGPCKPHEIQQDQVQGPAHGSGQSQAQIQAGQRMDWKQPWVELGDAGWWQVQRDPAVWAQSPEGQSSPPLHQLQHGHQVEGDSAPLLHSGETPPGVLHPTLELSAQERHGPVGMGPEDGHKDDLRAGTHLLWEKAERIGAPQPWEEKALGTPSSGLPVPEGSLQESWRGTFYKGMYW